MKPVQIDYRFLSCKKQVEKMTSRTFSNLQHQDHRIITTNDTLRLPRFPHIKTLKWLEMVEIPKS